MYYLVRNGFTPKEALVAGTRNVAEAYGVSYLIGTLESGKFADILIIEGDPLRDITILQDKERINTVIKNGEIVLKNGNILATVCQRLRPYPPGHFADNK